jgi:hypothetical protein
MFDPVTRGGPTDRMGELGDFAAEKVPVEIWERILGSFIDDEAFFQTGSQIRSFKAFRFRDQSAVALSKTSTEWRTLRGVCRPWKDYIDGRTLFIDGGWVHRSRDLWAGSAIARARRIRYDYSAFDSCLLNPSRWSIVEMDIRTPADLSSFRSLAAASDNHPVRRLHVTIYQAIERFTPAFISDLNRFENLVYLSLADHSQFAAWWPQHLQCMITLPQLEVLEWSIVDFPSHLMKLPALRHLYLRHPGQPNLLSIWNLILPYAPTLRSLLLHDYYNETRGYSLQSFPWVLFPRLEELSLSLLEVTASVISEPQSLPPIAHPLKRLYVYISILAFSHVGVIRSIIQRLKGGLESVHLVARGPRNGFSPVTNLLAFEELSQICAECGVRLEDGHGTGISELLNGV